MLVTDESEDDVRALLVAPRSGCRRRPGGDLGHEGVDRVVDHGPIAEVDGDALEHDRPTVVDAGDRRRPAKTAVTVPVPSPIITSRLGTPLRGATITRCTSPPTRTGPARRLVDRRDVEAAAAVLQPCAVELVDRRAETLAQR